MADETKFYFDFNFPLKFVGFLLSLIFGKRDPNNPATTVDPANREWFSQPRTFADGGTEVITTAFKLPLSVSEITMEILRMPCTAEVWYQDRSNNWRQVLDMQRIPLKVNVSRSDVKSYFKYQVKCYPIVAKKLQFRLTRLNDLTLEGTPFPVGLKNCLIRRNVYDRSQGSQYFEEEQDVLGNIITKYIKDWDAGKAVDEDPHTFWKCAPMPDPAAVASLYLDVRADDGGPKTIDKVYIDPVYTGQNINLYYSSDDSVGVRKLSPITVNPDEEENTDWRIGKGRSDVSTGLEESYYRWSLGLGPLVSQDAWVGIEWTPDFDPGDGPANNPVLLRAMDPAGPAFKPEVYYDVGAGEFVLQFSDGTDTRSYTAPMTQAFVPGVPLRIVAGWRYNPDTVYLSVRTQNGTEIAVLEDTPLTLPHLVSLDGQLEMYRFRGIISALVIKLEDFDANGLAFQTSPTYYVDPDPVIPDVVGNVPSTTLDHAVYAYAATAQMDGSGGASDTAYDEKEWTPIWRDYVAEKGMLFFPQAISMKYLKLEFTNLTEEPYPIYESGVEVRYKVFPVSVLQHSSVGPRLYTGSGGFLGLGTFISINGVKSINWLNPLSVLGAIGTVFSTQTDAVRINDGASFITDTLPNNGTDLVQSSRRLEAGSSYVYRREVLQPYILAEDAYVTTIKAEGLQALQPFTDVPWNDIAAANPGAITHVKSTGALPVRGTDWWIYPGQQLRVPASVMLKLTGTSTVTERKLTLEKRVRFNTTSIHRYDYKTLKRDAAIAYFAGVREVQPFTSTYIAGEDKPYFEFPHYDPDQFVLSRVRQNEQGSTTTQRKLYPIANRLFERDLKNWILDDPTPRSGQLLSNPDFATDISNWNTNFTIEEGAFYQGAWDGTDGHTAPGSLKFAGTGYSWADCYVVSVQPGEGVQFGGWVKTDITANCVFSMGVTFTDADGAQVGDFVYLVNTPAMTSWTRYGGAINAPAGAVSVQPWVDTTHTAAGVTWFDDMSLTTGGPWSWDGTTGRFLRGTALCAQDGNTHTILSDLQDAIEGDSIDLGVSVKWAGLTGLDADDVAIRWGIRTYLNNTMVAEVQIGEISYTDWSTHLTEDWQDLSDTTTFGSGIDSWRVFLQVTNQVAGGSVWFENVFASDSDATAATVFKSVQTASTFSKVAVDFRDSGLWRGDSMWADINPDSQSIDDTKLAYYVTTIPSTMPGGFWGDTNKAWGGDDIEWGSPFGVVSVTVDPDRIRDGRRVLHFRRVAGAGEAGIKVKQWTHFVPLGLFRIGAVFYKPLANDNQATVRLRRMSDGVIVYEETVEAPAGRWYEFQTKFVEIPDGVNQEYEVMLTLDGDDEDELYLADLYTEIANIRYFVRLGGVGAYLHEVTDLRYINGRANVTVTTPVNEFNVQAAIMSPEAWAYGARVTPLYLK